MTIFDIVGDFDLKIKLYSLDDAIIKIWKYKECICMVRKNKHLEVENCYVFHPRFTEHDFDGEEFPVLVFDCHGGITFYDMMVIGGNFDECFCVGFDYAHGNDYSRIIPFGHYTEIPDKMAECESLAQQIIEYFENA